MHAYVRSLPSLTTTAQAGDFGAEGAQGPLQGTKVAGKEGKEEISAGSLGHPVLCQRPCVHVVAGRRCEAGANCGFCHLSHDHVLRLDKQQRRMIAEMSKADFLRVVWQLLKDKARDAGLQGTEPLLNILENELKSENSNPTTVAVEPPQRLRRCLRPASFAAVAGLAARKCTEGGGRQLHEEMKLLRERF